MKAFSRRKLKKIAEKYNIAPRWLLEISSNTVRRGALRKLAAKIVLRDEFSVTNVSFAKSSPILSPRHISKIADIPLHWLYYHRFKACPLWIWKVRAVFKFPPKYRERLLPQLVELERRIDVLAQRIFEDATTLHPQGKEVKANGNAEND